MVGGIFLESALSEKSQVADCACPDEIQVNMQQEAGWFFGEHKNQNTQVADCACPDEIQVNMQQEAGWFFGEHKNQNTHMCDTRFFGITIDSKCCS